MSWFLILYIFAAVIIGTYPTMTLQSSGRTVSAIAYFILILIVLIFFGLRWFQYTRTDVGGAWPPIVNTCPDYLTYFKRPSTADPSGFTPSCIDLIGISRNANMTKWRPEFQMNNPPPEDKYYFSLVTSSQDTTAKNQELCTRAIEKGLSWEGITNGESCYSQTFAKGVVSKDDKEKCD